MAGPSTFDTAGRKIAGLLGYNPGPGIYSRLERAIEQMPENVRVQELLGLLKRYKDGVPGWELKASGLDELTAGRDVVTREELLARVRDRSPVYTHKEVVLTENTPTETVRTYVPIPGSGGLTEPGVVKIPDYQDEASAIGQGVAHGDPRYSGYSQGGEGYTEILLAQPGARSGSYGNHWDSAATNATDAHKDAVAHARFDVHDGFLRVNELQSDLGIHNRKMREQAAFAAERLRGLGQPMGSLTQAGDLPFPLEDAALELLLKRLNLYAARSGLKGVEIASPRAIADTVGGNIDNYEHAYGKVAVGQQERLGRKLGGMESVPVQSGFNPEPVSDIPYGIMEAEYRARDAFEALAAHANMYKNPDQLSAHGLVEDMVDVMRMGQDATPYAERLQRHMVTHAVENGWPPRVAEEMVNRNMQDIMREAENWVHVRNQKDAIAKAAHDYEPPPKRSPPPVYRGVMSDEMRRRIIQEGIPAAVALGIGADAMIDRLGQEQR
jgi:hypothetical protein